MGDGTISDDMGAHRAPLCCRAGHGTWLSLAGPGCTRTCHSFVFAGSAMHTSSFSGRSPAILPRVARQRHLTVAGHRQRILWGTLAPAVPVGEVRCQEAPRGGVRITCWRATAICLAAKSRATGHSPAAAVRVRSILPCRERRSRGRTAQRGPSPGLSENAPGCRR